MKKNNDSTAKPYRVIADSAYILLPDQKVARLLTPTIRNEQTYYNLFLPDYTRLSLKDIDATLAEGKVTKAPLND
jgi:hypothetical protein